MKTMFGELFAFRTVVDTDSVTVAAEQLGQTVSGASRALHRLEEKLDATLLSRITRRLSLTDGDATFLAQVHRIFVAVDEAKEQIALRRQQSTDRLRVSAAMPLMLCMVAPLVSDPHARYLQIELEPNTNDPITDLLEEGTDMTIRIGTLRNSALCARLLNARRLRMLVSPAYLKTHGRSRHVDGLQKHVLLGFVQPESLNQQPLHGPYGDRLCIEPMSKASGGGTLRQFALQDIGIVCLADSITAEDRCTSDLVQVLLDITVKVLQPIHAVYYRNTQLASRIACFLDFLETRLADDKQ